jgi:hypothetical protein
MSIIENITALRPAVMSYVFRCPNCHCAPNRVDHADLRPELEQLLSAEWQCSDCDGWARIQVQMPDCKLMVEPLRGRRAQQEPAFRLLRVLYWLQEGARRRGRDTRAIDEKVKWAEEAIKQIRRDMWEPIWGPCALPESGVRR